MNRDPLPRRRSLRAPAHDYTAPAAYFITVVTQHRACLFGKILDDRFHSTPAGDLVTRLWHGLPNRFPLVELDHFDVMPNHVHSLLWLTEESAEQPVILGAIVGAFKSLAAREINAMLGRTGPLWQRNYYERVVRDETEPTAIRKYIEENPLRWALDAENPDR